MADIVHSDKNVVISADSIPFSAYQEIYRNLTSKVETLRNTFKDIYEVDFASIEQLHIRIQQITSQFNIKLHSTEVVLSVKDDHIHQFSSFDTFKIFNFTIPKPTKKLNYKFDFAIVIPSTITGTEDIPQRYQLDVLIDQDFPEDEGVNFPFFVRDFLFGQNITSKIEYADYSVGRLMQSVVEEWEKGLKKFKRNPLERWLTHIEPHLRNYLPVLAIILALFSGAMILQSSPGLSAPQAAAITLSMLAISFLMQAIVGDLVDRFYKALVMTRPQTKLVFTAGDRTRNEEDKKRRSYRARLASIFATSVVISLVMSFLSRYLYDNFL